MIEQEALILLQDGKVFHGKSAGKIGTAVGEICFNTGMTGYQEVFTDPSYYGQVMVATNAHIGNYGIKDSESQSSSIKISAFICRNFNTYQTRKVADKNIEQYFIENNLVAIKDVDTRALVKYIRSKGAMNCVVSSEISDIEILKSKLELVPDMNGLELSSVVCTQEPYFLGNENSSLRIAVLDLGVKQNILSNFTLRDVYLKVFPARTTFQEMNEWNPNGYFLSNGPGDPAAMPYAVTTANQIIASGKPVFGICLGHQILAQAFGLSTYKMHNGHRGLNHPVKNIIKNHCEITSQNHGFCVNQEDIENHPELEITHINLNDNTIEGLRHKTKPIFSVQYHPEAAPGPNDANYLFDDFMNLLK